MLEQLRQSSRSFLIWLLFGIIIAVFIINFGPQANQQVGCGASDTYALRVDDAEVDETSWRYGMNSLGMRTRNNAEKSAVVLDGLIVRELLAQAAEEAGFEVTTDLINERIRDGEIYLLGQPLDGSGIYYRDGVFDYDLLERVVQSIGLPSVDRFIDEQKRELMAATTRELLLESVQASPEEALTRYKYANETATIDYVEFRPAEYRTKLTLSPEQVAAYLAQHADEIKAAYDAEAATYKDRKPEAKIRQIFVAREAPADPAAANAAVDPAKVKAEAALVRIRGGEDFAAVAESLGMTDGGLIDGWRNLERPGLGEAALGEALGKLEPAEVSEIIDTPRGFYLLQLVETREGDLSFEQVKRDLAASMARDYYARQAARRDAEEALALARSQNKNLAELYPRAEGQSPSLGKPPQQMSPEELQQLIDQLQNAAPGEQSGSLIIESANIPAEWNGTQAAVPALFTQQAVASEASAGEMIPKVEGIEHRVKTAGPFPNNRESIPGLGKAPALLDTIFGPLKVGAVAEEVAEVDGNFVIVQKTAVEHPDLQAFETDQDALVQSFAEQRKLVLLRDWLESHCRSMAEAGEISFDQRLLEDRSAEQPVAVNYTPCQNVAQFAQLALLPAR